MGEYVPHFVVVVSDCFKLKRRVALLFAQNSYWVAAFVGNGEKYYYNTITNKTRSVPLRV